MKDFRKPEVKAIVSVGGERINIISLKLHQRMCEHHDCELLIDHRTFDQAFFDAPEKKLALVNTKVIIDLQPGDNIGKAYTFSGLVTSVRMLAEEGQHGVIQLLIKSNTIELERGKICQTYSNTNLYTIIKEITADTRCLSTINKPDYKSDIPFAIQYKEDDWTFLRRTLHTYNVLYHYNGLDLIIGAYPEYPVINLTYDLDIKSLEVCSRLKANEETNYFYRREDHSTISQDSPKEIDGANYYLNEISKQANYLTRKRKPNAPIEGHMPDMDSLMNQMKRKKVATGAEMMYIKAEIKSIDLWIGRLINVRMPASMGGGELGTYRVYDATYQIDQNSRFSCHFEAVPADLKYLPTPEVKIPVVNPIVCECWSNQDPLGIGRVKVKFPFDERPCDLFMAQMTPDSGGNGYGLGSKSRGFSFVAEQGDSLLVSFLDEQLSEPFVMGSVFHGLNADNLGGQRGNHMKTIRDKSNNLIEMDSSVGGIRIVSEKSKNTIIMDGEGQIIIDAPKKLILNSTDIEINAKNNIEVTVGNNIVTNVMNGVYEYTPYYKQVVEGSIEMYSAKSLIHSLNSMNLESPILKAIGTNEVLVHSDNKATVNSKGTTYVHGESKTSFTNTPEKEDGSGGEKITDVIVDFRTLQSNKQGYPKYDGEFGFDWLRIDESTTTEKDYESILERAYCDGIKDHIKTSPSPLLDAFQVLEEKYYTIAVNPTTQGKPLSKYYIPYLTIYPKNVNGSQNPAREIYLRMLLTIPEDKDPDRIEIHFPNAYLQIEDSDDPYQISPVEIYERDKTEIVEPIKITSKEEFSDNQYINVYAFFPKGATEERVLAGRILVLANARNTIRRTQKIVLLPVKLNFGGGTALIKSGQIYGYDKEYTYKHLYQAYIYADIDQRPEFDMSGISITGYLNGSSIDKNKRMNLLALIKREYLKSHTISAGSILVVCVDANDDSGSTRGATRAHMDNAVGYIVNDKDIILFPRRNNDDAGKTTCAHEIGHALALEHTHADNKLGVDKISVNGVESDVIATPMKQFIYEENKTDNLMSYKNGTHDRRSLWAWQWKIMNGNVKAK